MADLETKMAVEHWKTYLLLHASNMTVVVAVSAEPAFHETDGLVSQLKRRTLH
jgi:hypothetical protein